jgi:hypothetical protein
MSFHPPVPGQTAKEGTLWSTAGSGTVDFINASDNSVFSSSEYKLKAGTSIRLFYPLLSTLAQPWRPQPICARGNRQRSGMRPQAY